jgi:hypothetical protein
MKTKLIVIAMAAAFAGGCHFFDRTDRSAQPAATGDKPATASPTPQRGQPAGSSVGDANAGAFWTEHARGGYMTKDQAMKYKDKQGKTVDFKKMDADADNRVSQTEWQNYHAAFAQKEGGPAEAAGSRPGAAGPSGADAPKPSTTR